MRIIITFGATFILLAAFGCSGGAGSADQGNICAYDDDCEEHCTVGINNQAPYCTGSCDAERQCPEGYSCLGADMAGLVCVMGSCQADLDCPTKYTCDTASEICEHTVVACTTDDDCPAEVACNQGSCVFRCESEDDCKQDFYCDYLTRCVECTNNLHCENGYSCNWDGGVCNQGCIRDNNCRAGYECTADVCARIIGGGSGAIGSGCAEDTDCEIYCQDGTCSVSCNGEDDVTSCPSGYSCHGSNGICQAD